MYKTFWLERKKPPGKPRHKCEDNIKNTLGEMEFTSIDMVHLAHYNNRVTGFYDHENGPLNFTGKVQFFIIHS